MSNKILTSAVTADEFTKDLKIPRMKQLLVPTDFSTCADNAIDFAVQSSKMFSLPITLVHAFDLRGDIYTDYMGINKEFNQSLLREIRTKIAGIKKNIEEKEGVVIDTFVSTASIKEGIFQVTTEKNIDLIVMGTTGASGIKEKIWGSRTASIIGKSNVPVLAIPTEYKWKKPVKILLATNHFEKEPAMLDFLFELADLYGAQVHVAVFTDEVDDEALTFLEHARNIPGYEKLLRTKYQDDTLTVNHLFGNDFEQALQDYIGQNKIDMVAMVSYKRKFPDSLFHPSITKKMAYHTKIPLLAIPVKHE